MKLAVCHYSFHRRWQQENWGIDRLTDEVNALGVEGIDYHARLLGVSDGLVENIWEALERTGLELAGFSLSTNFNLDTVEESEEHIQDTLMWLRIAEQLQAPVCRIFGGRVNRDDRDAMQAGFERVVRALRILAPEAERMGLVLALENHGGLPCTAEEQVEMLKEVGSPALKATVDLGNYMQGGQTALEGTRIAAPYAAYVHVKDNSLTGSVDDRGRNFESCTIGRGDVDIPGCLRILKRAGFNGVAALEYEGPEDEKTGVPESVRYMKEIMA